MTQRAVYQHLREFAEHFTPPPPFSPHLEISDGQIVMMMSPSGAHDLNAGRITKQLAGQIADGLFVYTGDIEHPLAAKMRRPDVIVVEERAMETMGAIDATAVALVVEVVSPSNPENDYVGKVRDYPLMGIPHYVIVDPRDGTAVHYWEPEGGTYANVVHYKYGEKVTVGEWVIDTADLYRYGREGLS
jgi:Uma2 family endonuclease